MAANTRQEDGVGPGGDKAPVSASAVWTGFEGHGSHGSLLSREGRITREGDGAT